MGETWGQRDLGTSGFWDLGMLAHRDLEMWVCGDMGTPELLLEAAVGLRWGGMGNTTPSISVPK